MNKVLRSIGKVVAKGAITSASTHVNSTCYFIHYQPKMPNGAEKLKRR